MIDIKQYKESIVNIINTPEYGCSSKSYDSDLLQTLSINNMEWIYVKPYEIIVHFPNNIKDNLIELEVYIHGDLFASKVIKHIIKRFKEISNLFGILLTIKNYQENGPKQFSSIISKYINNKEDNLG